MLGAERPVTILQFGKTGQIARELIRRAASGSFAIRCMSRAEVDFSDPQSLAQVVAGSPEFDVAVNAVAYTAVDRAEREEDVAMRINAEAVGILAEACARRGAPLIHISTDYVFDGKKPSAYVETDVPAPLNAYGRSKLAGEIALARSHSRHVVIRTSRVFSAFSENFVTKMLRLGLERNELRIVDDQWSCPTAARDVADAILAVARRVATNEDEAHWGLFHFTGAGVTSWAQFAESVFGAVGTRRGARPHIVPVMAADYGSAVPRPQRTELACAKIKSIYGISQPEWHAALAQVVCDNLDSAGEAMP